MTTTLSPAKVPPSFAMLDVRCIAPDATQVRRTFDHDALAEPVSYTHLTLPTILRV